MSIVEWVTFAGLGKIILFKFFVCFTENQGSNETQFEGQFIQSMLQSSILCGI